MGKLISNVSVKAEQTQAFTGEAQSSPQEVQNNRSGSNHVFTTQ